MKQQEKFNPTRFIQARQLARQTQESLARALNVSAIRIQHWETGRYDPPMEILKEISIRYGMVTPGFFFRDDPPNFPIGSLLFHEIYGYKRYDDWNGEDSKPLPKLRVMTKHL